MIERVTSFQIQGPIHRGVPSPDDQEVLVLEERFLFDKIVDAVSLESLLVDNVQSVWRE